MDKTEGYFDGEVLRKIQVNTDFSNREVRSVIMKHENLSKMKNLLGQTLLHYAARYRNLEIMEFLIESGAEVNAQSYNGKTPLSAIVNLATSSEFLMVFECLVKAGADIELEDGNGKSALKLVLCNENFNETSVQKFFLNVVQRQSNNDNRLMAGKLLSLGCPLWTAVLSNNSKMIEHMILSGQHVDSCQPRTKITALHMAVSEMDLKMVEILIKHGANVDLEDDMGLLPIGYYGLNNPNGVQQPEIIRILLARSTLLKDLVKNNGIVQLKRAFQCGNREIIRMLIEYCSDIFDFEDAHGQTPLHYVAVNPHSDVIEELRGLKIDVNVRDNMGCSPLLIAARCRNSHTNIFRFLLKNGADVNASNNQSDVPLFALCRTSGRLEKDYSDIIDIFFKYDVKISFLRNTRQTIFNFISNTSQFNVAEPILAYLALWEDQGKSVAQIIRKTIDSSKMLKSYFDDCQRHLVQIKAHTTDNEQRLTCYMFLVTPEEKIVKMCRYMNDSLSQLEYLKNECSFDHKYYNTMIKNHIDIVVEKIKLHQEAALVICRILKLENNIYHLVVIEILDYLSYNDLESLVKSNL